MDDDELWRLPLDPHALQAAAGPEWRVEYVDAAPSTNALAMEHPAPGLVVVTDHQTAGRGRLDRTWETPRGVALTMSAVIEPDLSAERWPLIPLATGLAVAGAIGPRARLKWPNDVLVDERKVCGILAERPAAHPEYVVIGIGLNVDQTETELPVPVATSLRIAGLDRDRTRLLGDVLSGLSARQRLLEEAPTTLLADYRTASATLGREVSVHLPDGRVVHGRAVAVDGEGRLHVDTATGPLVVGAGDVVHARLD